MPPNVLLVVLDSVRARNTSLHGHVHDTTPFLSDFAADTATVYEQARAPGARSITSHASIFTGLHVEEHGITSADEKLRPGNTIFERLRDEHGYDTGVFSENVWITDVDVGLEEGFDTVEGPQNMPYPDALDPRTFVAQEGRGQYGAFIRESLRRGDTARSLANGLYIKLASDYPHLVPTISGSTPGGVYRDLFLDWAAARTEPWAACVNLMDAHGPYKPRPEHNEWGDDDLLDVEDAAPEKWELACTDARWWRRVATEALYDGCIRGADAHVGGIVRGLADQGVLDDTLVVVTSDHGEGFGEPSRIRPGVRVAAHNVSIHEVVLHVPLVVKFPGQTRPARVEEVATLTRFPDAVRSALDGTWAPDAFVPDRAVVASTYGLTADEQLRKRALRHCSEGGLRPFDARSRAAFEDAGDGTVTKTMTWRSEAATVAVRDAQTSYKVSGDGTDRVEAAFDGIRDAGIRTEGGGVDELDEGTYRRLEELGYV